MRSAEDESQRNRDGSHGVNNREKRIVYIVIRKRGVTQV